MMSSPHPRTVAQLPDMITTEEAYAAGLTKRDLSRENYRKLFRGAYVRAGAHPTYTEQLAFALRVVPSARFVAEHSAARHLGAVTPPASNVHLGTRVRHKCNHDGIQLRFYKNPPDLIVVRGVPTTSPGQTFLDLARSLEFIDLLVLGDSLVRRTGCSTSYLRNFTATSSSHGARHAREVAALIRDNVDSPNESRLRLLMLGGGLPEPVVNEVVHDESRARIRRLDLAYREWRVAVEFDGRHHIERVSQWDSDIMRREELEAMGWRFVIVTSAAMYAEPLRVLRRIADVLAAAGGPRIALRDDWQRHFG